MNKQEIEKLKKTIDKLELKLNGPKVQVVNFELLSLQEKQKLGQIYHILKNLNKTKFPNPLIPEKAARLLADKLVNREFTVLKPFYLFLVEQNFAGLVIDPLLNREARNYYHDIVKYVSIDYEP